MIVHCPFLPSSWHHWVQKDKSWMDLAQVAQKRVIQIWLTAAGGCLQCLKWSEDWTWVEKMSCGGQAKQESCDLMMKSGTGRLDLGLDQGVWGGESHLELIILWLLTLTYITVTFIDMLYSPFGSWKRGSTYLSLNLNCGSLTIPELELWSP